MLNGPLVLNDPGWRGCERGAGGQNSCCGWTSGNGHSATGVVDAVSDECQWDCIYPIHL